MSGPSREILNPQEAAEIIGVNPRTLVKWARQNYVPAHPLGEGRRKLWRFFRNELVEWTNRQQKGVSR